MKTDGQTDKRKDMAKLTVAFRNFAIAPKNASEFYKINNSVVGFINCCQNFVTCGETGCSSIVVTLWVVVTDLLHTSLNV